MLQKLDPESVSLAWEYLTELSDNPPPLSLQHLSGEDWAVLSYLLHHELNLKRRSLLN
jgi:hypothetical protein